MAKANALLDSIDPYTFTGSAFVIGLVLANKLSANEQASVGNWLQLVGLTIQTYSSQQTIVEEKTDPITTIQDSIEEIKKELEKLQKEKEDKEQVKF